MDQISVRPSDLSVVIVDDDNRNGQVTKGFTFVFAFSHRYRRLTDVWVGLTEPLGQKSISFNNLLWENGKRYYHGTVAI